MTIATAIAVFAAGYIIGALSGLTTAFLVSVWVGDMDEDDMSTAYEEWK